MRTKFEEQLAKLNVELIEMGALCEEAISAAVAALLEGDGGMREKAFQTDREIDQKERDIEGMCLRLLLQQQPVARDLRAISSALKMISDMERIGDQASDIAEISAYVADNDTKSKVHIRDMSRAVMKMVSQSVDAYVKKDMTLSRAVVEYDDVVDDYFDKIKTELIGLIGEQAGNGALCLDLLMIAKYLERIGDHAVNIAEWVEFSLTGKHVE